MPNLDDKAKSKDGAEITAENTAFTPVRKKYRVTAIGGLFKNGQQIDEGGIVELDQKTAAAFAALNEVEIIPGQEDEEGGSDE